MRLINTSTYKPKLFKSYQIPPYAILSHRWGDDEVSLSDLAQSSKRQAAGYQKIQGCCRQAAQDGFDWVWADTCCIDQQSSAELSEAINSMYRWYQGADVCYAYLSDVPSGEVPQTDSAFARSKWFTRGWTLQELLAPASVIFFDQNWVEIGTKASLHLLVSYVTGIDAWVLLAEGNAGHSCSIGKKMSWASQRETTRVEDSAYCLMGIFGINMPLLYGEGNNAFRRLQLEILKESTDHSLFAWIEDEPSWHAMGLLALTPAKFSGCGKVCEVNNESAKLPYNMTNKGLLITLRLIEIPENSSFYANHRALGKRGQKINLAFLDCAREDELQKKPTVLAIKVQELSGGIFGRESSNKIESIESSWVDRAHTREVWFHVSKWENPGCIRRRLELQASNQYCFLIKTTGLIPKGRNSGCLLKAIDPDCRNEEVLGEETGLSLTEGQTGKLFFQNTSKKRNGFLVILGMRQYTPWCDILTDIDNGDFLQAIEHCERSTATRMRESGLDRVSRSLSKRKTVSVAVRMGRRQGKICHLVDILVSQDKSAQNVESSSLQGADSANVPDLGNKLDSLKLQLTETSRARGADVSPVETQPVPESDKLTA